MNTYTYDDILIGQEEQFEFYVSDEYMDSFCKMTGDNNPLHTDKEYATKRGYRDRVCYGMLTASFLSTLAGVYLPGERSLIHSVQINMLQPVYVNDKLKCIGIVTNKTEAYKSIKINFEIKNMDSENVLSGNMRIGIVDDSE